MCGNNKKKSKTLLTNACALSNHVELDETTFNVRRIVPLTVSIQSDAVVAVIIVRIVFISSFLFYCFLLNHSFQTNPNKITNCFQLILSIYKLTTTLLLRRYFDFLRSKIETTACVIESFRKNDGFVACRSRSESQCGRSVAVHRR